ncbi:MAG: ABC transporter ATP-binding protein [Oscillospiraceae bacterium]
MIEAKEFSKKFEDYMAVDSLNMTFEKGHIYGLVGTNGSGKSTFLRSICGVYKPYCGHIEIDGNGVYDSVEAKQRVFFVNDESYFLPNVSVDDMAQFYKGFYPNWSQTKYEKLTQRFPIDSKKKIKTFSKGMKRQAAIILALSCQTEYLLLDEAFDGLDPVIRVAARKLIADEVAERDIGVVIASHNLRELEDFCDTVAILHKGRLVTQQNVEEISKNFCKVQAAFKPPIDIARIVGEKLLSVKQNGSIVNIIAACGQKEMEDIINPLSPVLSEYIPLTLEEVFIYEMEAVGYDYNNIIF